MHLSSTGSPVAGRTFTPAAAGRKARTTAPPSVGCAPRMSCGLACSRRTSRSRSVTAARAMDGSLTTPIPSRVHPEPGGPMDYKLELVAVPVSDVDRAKDFYVDKAGFNAD